jgi:OmpA-OmpF porin, OOP family
VEVVGHAPDPSIADGANGGLSSAMPAGFTSSVVIEADKPKVAAKAPSTVLEPPKVVKPPEPPKVVEAAKPVEPPKPAEPAKPVVVAKPAEPVKPAEPAKPAKSAYVWDAVLDHGTVTISGGVPKGEARDLVLSLIASRLSGVTVINNLKQVDSLPSSEDDWLHSVDAGLKAVADLGAGRAHIEDRALSVTGQTSDRAMPDYIAETLHRAVPGSYKASANVDYVPPPAPPAYLTTVKYDGLHVVVEGVVPDLATKAKFLARLKPLFPDRDFDDRTTVQHGAPDGWYEALIQGVGPLSTLGNGQLTLRDRNLYLSGTAEDQRILANARQRISSTLPRGYGGKDLLTYVAPPAPDPKLLAKRQDESKYDVGKLVRQTSALSAPECQAVFNSLLRGKVFFASGRANLDARSAQSLNSVIAIAKRCPATRVEISGHTDSDGAAAFNQKLSENRAQAVAKYLAGKGISFTRMDAVGYGETQPVAPNDSAANKAKNRRIEFAMTPG